MQLDIRADYANPQKYIPEAKCNNRTLKEQVSSNLLLPFLQQTIKSYALSPSNRVCQELIAAK